LGVRQKCGRSGTVTLGERGVFPNTGEKGKRNETREKVQKEKKTEKD